MGQSERQPIRLPIVSRSPVPPARRMTAATRVKRPPEETWRRVASCRDRDANLFYPIGKGKAALEQAEKAKVICRACPSREPCLAFALATRQHLGVWGGTTTAERRQLVRARQGAVAS